MGGRGQNERQKDQLENYRILRKHDDIFMPTPPL